MKIWSARWIGYPGINLVGWRRSAVPAPEFRCMTPEVWHFDKADWRDYLKLICRISRPVPAVFAVDGSGKRSGSNLSFRFRRGQRRCCFCRTVGRCC